MIILNNTDTHSEQNTFVFVNACSLPAGLIALAHSNVRSAARRGSLSSAKAVLSC